MSDDEKSKKKLSPLLMLAEIAHQLETGKIQGLRPQRSRNKVGNSSQKKSINKNEKLSLKQIKGLSKENLLEMFSEPVYDEIDQRYSLKCFLIPDKCSVAFKSYPNESAARCLMEIHLNDHIRDLFAAAKASNNHETFMAEPLHVRKRRLQENNLNNLCNITEGRQLPTEGRNDGVLERFFQGHHNQNVKMNRNNTNSASRNNSSPKLKAAKQYVSYSGSEHFFSKSRVLLRVKSCDNGKSNFPSSTITQSESDVSLPVHHDHTYTSLNGKTRSCEPPSVSDNNRSANKVFRDPFHPKKIHECFKRDSPLIIPTPRFPEVYDPILPHIALIQEVGHNTKKSKCECTDGFQAIKSFPESSHNSIVPLLLPKSNECPKNSVNISSSNIALMNSSDNMEHSSDVVMTETSNDMSSQDSARMDTNNTFNEEIIMMDTKDGCNSTDDDILMDTEDDENTPCDDCENIEINVFLDPEYPSTAPDFTLLNLTVQQPPSIKVPAEHSENDRMASTSNIKVPRSSSCSADVLRPECPEGLRAVEKV